MRYKTIVFIISVLLISHLTIISIDAKVKLVLYPGHGLLFGKDSILIGRTNMRDFVNKYKIKQNLPSTNKITVVMWDGYNSKVDKDTHGAYYYAVLKIKSIEFAFESPDMSSGIDPSDYSKYYLKDIYITNISHNITVLLDTIDLAKANLKITELFPLIDCNKDISSDSLEYRLHNYGITFIFEKRKKDKYIQSIKVYKCFTN